MVVLSGSGDHFPNYGSVESHPAQLIMDNWVRNLHDLVYLPAGRFGHLEGQPLSEFAARTGDRKEPSQADLIAFANPANWPERMAHMADYRRNELNYFRAIRMLYRSSGWPNHYDRAGLLSALGTFRNRAQEYDKKLKQLNPRALQPVPYVTLTPEEMTIRRAKDDFLQEAAGPLAIKRLEQYNQPWAETQ
jgi:hypothetical protein